MLPVRICAGGAGSTGVPTATERVNFENSSLIAKRRSVLRSLEISKCVAKSVIWYFSTPC
jgi:hypothetical protein